MICMVKFVLIVLLFGAHALKVHAARAKPDLDACFASVGRASGISPALLKAIAKVESSLNASAVNGSHRNRTGSYDIGLMQINSRWLPQLRQYGITENKLYEACTSVEVGAWILVDLFRRYGNKWEAVGAYNAACTQLTPTQCRVARDKYISKVRRALEMNAVKPKESNQKILNEVRVMASNASGIKTIEFTE